MADLEGQRRVRELFEGLDLTDEQTDMVRNMLMSAPGVSTYIGRYEVGGFGHDFLPDAFTDHGDVQSVAGWIEGALGMKKAGTVRVRITVERLDG